MGIFILLEYGIPIRGGSKVKKAMEKCAPDYSLVLTFYHSLIRLTLIASKKNHSLEVVSPYHDPQLQVGENYSYLLNL